MKKLFISHDKKDKWVRDCLVPHLQGYEAEILAEHLTFKIGISRLQNIEDAIEAADHTLLVVSPNWLASEWTELESLMLQTDSPANRKHNFLILRLEDCELPRRLRPFTDLDLTDAATHVGEIGRLMGQLGIPQRDGEQIPPIVSTDTPLNPDSATPTPPPSPSPPDPPIKLPDLTDFAAVLSFNQANLNRLKAQMGRPGKVIPFVGAGMSVPYGFKSWWGYLMFHAEQYGIAKAIKDLLNDGKYEEAAQVLLEAMSPHAFHAAITDEYGQQKLKDFQPRAVTALIPRLTAGPVITTNYDQVLERTFERAGQAFYRVALGAQVGGVSQAVESHRNILLKVHGDAEEPTNRILTLAEYQQHYGDVDKGGYDSKLPLPKALSRLMGATPLLFLGCSLEVDRTMKVLSAITQALDHGGHYAILPLPKDPSKLPTRKRELSQHHVFPIWYDSSKGHGMVEEILRWVLGEEGLQQVETGADVAEKVEWPPLLPHHISLFRLPDTSGYLFGRENELTLLDAAWDNGTHIVCFVAQGGEGKTALTRHWVNLMEKSHFRGAERVYAWSFYSQGTSEDRQISSDLFLAETLTWFGDTATANSGISSSKKAQRLATLIREQRTLLILDGMEPLQYPQNLTHDGRIRDEGLRTLLKELGNSNPGLLVISTRVWVMELDSFISSGVVKQQTLSHLNKVAGSKLLRALGVTKGRKEDFEGVVEEYHGHALALTLLGNLLRDYYDGDVRKRDVIPPLEEDGHWGGHARRVLIWYEQRLAGKPELNILRILGLFDRPVDPALLIALRSWEPIIDITNSLIGLNDLGWKKAVRNLHNIGLLEDGDALDCHPLIREYHSTRLATKNPQSWKLIHKKLFEYFTSLQEKYFPDTHEEIDPLYRATWHGCKAGLFQEVFDVVLFGRIHRENLHYSTRVLGQYSFELSVLSAFFKSPWIEVYEGLEDYAHSTILNEAGLCLQCVGRLEEAVAPMLAALEIRKRNIPRLKGNSIAGNIGNLYLSMGDLERATNYGKEAVELALIYKPMDIDYDQAILGEILHQRGLVDEAEELFERSINTELPDDTRERRFKVRQNYRLCEFLLDTNRASLAYQISETFLSGMSEKEPFISIGLMMLVHSMASFRIDPVGQIKGVILQVDDCTVNLEKSGQQYLLPKPYLFRAKVHRLAGDYPSAKSDLNKSIEIAEPSMRLHLADYHLESARLQIAMGDMELTKEHYEAAKKLIEETGYHRRDGELEDLRLTLEAAPASINLPKVIPMVLQPSPVPKPQKRPQTKFEQTGLPPIKVLLLAASPNDLPKLETTGEINGIIKLLSEGRFVGKVVPLAPIFDLGIEGLIAELSMRPDVVHFSGHGKTNGIFLVDRDGKGELVQLPTLRVLFGQLVGHTRLVLLNTCYSASQAMEISTFGFYVAGYNGMIADPAAIAFSRGLYIGLSAGKSVVDSLRDGLALLLHKDATGAEALEVWKDGERVWL